MWDLSGCPAYVENWGSRTVTNSLSNLVVATEKRACKAAPKNRREWDPHQNWPSCMPYLEVSKSINLHNNKTHTCVSILPLKPKLPRQPKTSILYERIVGTHWWLITASSMAATAAVLNLPQKKFGHLCFWFILNLKEIHYWLDWVSEGCYTCYYFFFIFCYWWHNSLFCCKRGGIGCGGCTKIVHYQLTNSDSGKSVCQLTHEHHCCCLPAAKLLIKKSLSTQPKNKPIKPAATLHNPLWNEEK